MAGLTKSLAVAKTTFRETIRNKVLLHLCAFAVLMMLIGWVVSNWSLGEPEKIVADIGLSAAVLIGVAIALFSGIALVWGEVEQKTILPILAKPLTRTQFIFGKFIGFAASITLVYTGMNLFLLLLLLIVGTPVTHQIIAAIYLSLWEALVVVALALLFSSFAAPTLSAIFTAMIFIAGRFSGDIRVFIEENPFARSRPVLEAVYAIIPHLSYFNLRLQAVHNLPIGWEQLLTPTLYGILYIVLVLMISVIVFMNRDLA